MFDYSEELYLVKALDSIDEQEDHKLYSFEELDYELDYVTSNSYELDELD